MNTHAESTLQGWIMALIDTGYEKIHELPVGSGSSITVYQNNVLGKVVVAILFPDGQGWAGLYPQCGFWGDVYHHLAIPAGAKWEGTDFGVAEKKEGQGGG